MHAAQVDARQLEPFTSRLPDFDLESAYAVAHLLHERRLAEGMVSIGRKIGFTNSAMWARYGVREPIWAYVYDTTVTNLPANRGRCKLDHFAEPKIEPEIVFHFCATPRVGAELAELLQAIDWVAHGFEIVQSHFPGWQFHAADTVADWGLHGTLLVGEPVSPAALGPEPIAALGSFLVTLTCDGTVRELGKGRNVLGNPLRAVAHLMTALARQPESRPLHANEIVTTGTLTTAQTVRPGDTWQTTIQGIPLPGLTVTFEP
jgi:2-oxo-3-hexenedioate decarboxylase